METNNSVNDELKKKINKTRRFHVSNRVVSREMTSHYHAVECELALIRQGTMGFSILKACFSDFLFTFFVKQTRALSLQGR